MLRVDDGVGDVGAFLGGAAPAALAFSDVVHSA